MYSLKDYSIEIAKLKLGNNEANFLIDNNFFNLKANSLISEGSINVHLNIFKKEGLLNFGFKISGTINTECDICLDKFEMPVNGEETIFFKIVETPKESDNEMVYIDDSVLEINVYDYIYDIICTLLPMVKTCEKNAINTKQCNQQMLKYISNSEDESDEIKITTNSIKDNLKKL